MLKLTLEVFPNGNPAHAEVLAEAVFVNTSTSPIVEKFGDYRCEVFHSSLFSTTIYPRIVKIRKHERGRGYWPLIRRLAAHMEKVKK